MVNVKKKNTISSRVLLSFHRNHCCKCEYRIYFFIFYHGFRLKHRQMQFVTWLQSRYYFRLKFVKTRLTEHFARVIVIGLRQDLSLQTNTNEIAVFLDFSPTTVANVFLFFFFFSKLSPENNTSKH